MCILLAAREEKATVYHSHSCQRNQPPWIRSCMPCTDIYSLAFDTRHVQKGNVRSTGFLFLVFLLLPLKTLKPFSKCGFHRRLFCFVSFFRKCAQVKFLRKGTEKSTALSDCCFPLFKAKTQSIFASWLRKLHPFLPQIYIFSIYIYIYIFKMVLMA